MLALTHHPRLENRIHGCKWSVEARRSPNPASTRRNLSLLHAEGVKSIGMSPELWGYRDSKSRPWRSGTRTAETQSWMSSPVNVPIKAATCIPATPATFKIFVKVFRDTENLQDTTANEFWRCCCIFYLHRFFPVSLLIQHGTVKPDHGAAGWDLGQNQRGVEPRLRRSCRAHRQLLS